MLQNTNGYSLEISFVIVIIMYQTKQVEVK